MLLGSTRNNFPQAGASLTELLAAAQYDRHYSADTALSMLAACQEYTFPVSTENGSYYMTFSPINYNGWLLLTAIPRPVIDGQSENAGHMVYLLSATIIFLTFLLSLLYALENKKKSRQLIQERDQLHKSEELYRCLQDFSTTTLFEVDVATGDITYNQAFLDYLGRAPVIRSMFQYLEPNPIVYAEDMSEWLRFGKDMNEGLPSSTAELRTISEAGELIWHRVEYRYLYDAQGTAYRIVGRYTIINEEKSRLEKLQLLTETDSLTGLLNHRSMRSKINDVLVREGVSKPHALLVVDLDDFKLVNDTLGHIEGDAVLIRIAQSLRNAFRSTDMIARLGGDEFAVFIKNAPEASAVMQKAETLLNALQFIHMRDGKAVNVAASIGVALTDLSANVFEEVWSAATINLFRE